ncbi:hypothetical protein KY290_024177 [Solanum tuberosum]|uniref:NB-ARC domain-containing protein n=1 Tax=Solanum tuberosum TaxID=4113 RepID=A0ABQ7URX9_SOLTU|nr:hypothetical protein KY290_024177 [Solanum tuberosum]
METLQHNLKELPTPSQMDVALTDQILVLQEMFDLLFDNLRYVASEEVTPDLQGTIERIKTLIYHIIRKEFQSSLPRIHGIGYVDFLLGNLEKFHDRYPDSLAFMKTQLQIIQAELESVQPFSRFVAEQQYNIHDKLQNSVSLLVGKHMSVEVGEMQQKKLFDVDLVSPYTIATDTSFNSSELEKMPEIKEESIGFEDEIETLIDRLTRGSGKLDIISIVSIDGTSLLSKGTDELKDTLSRILHSKRYLILLDDVWDHKAWDDLKCCFPDDNNGSRVLLTMRNHDVADYVGSVGEPHHLRLLTYAESWELLCAEVFGNESFSPFLEKVGQEIARKCGGLPLSIVLVAGIY